MHYKDQSGFSLLEAMIGISIAAILMWGASRVFQFTMRTAKGSSDQTETNLVLYNAYEHVFRVGRTSLGCTLLVSPNKGIECEVFTITPPSEATKKVRFLQSTSNTICPKGPPCLAFQENNAGTWVTKLEYSGISDFTVCGDAAFTANSCPLGSTGINAAALDNLVTNPGLSDHYLRFSLTSDNKGQTRSFQGALFARNLPETTGSWIYEQTE